MPFLINYKSTIFFYNTNSLVYLPCLSWVIYSLICFERLSFLSTDFLHLWIFVYFIQSINNKIDIMARNSAFTVLLVIVKLSLFIKWYIHFLRETLIESKAEIVLIEIILVLANSTLILLLFSLRLAWKATLPIMPQLVI